MNIQIIVGSTREGRATPRVAKWVEKTARVTQGDHVWEVVDLADYDLPLFSESLPPLGNTDRHPVEPAQKWLDKLADADGYVIVTPEYNHGMPAALKNAIDYVDHQLMRKPVAIVSHGSVGGARSAEMLAQVLRSNIGAIAIPETVSIVGMVGFAGLITEEGELTEKVAGAQKPLEDTLASIVWYTEALVAKR